MIEFYQVTSVWIYSPTLNRIQQRYGLVAMGFYWKVVAKIFSMGGWCSKLHLLTLRDTGLRWKEACAILTDYDLFVIIDDVISLNLDNPDISVRVPPEIASRMHASGVRMSGAYASGAPGPACVSPECTSPACTSPASCAADSNLQSIEKEIREEESAKQNFSEFMNNECPHLLLFEEPMTFSDLKELRMTYSIDEIKRVLLAMENKIGVECTYRSCTDTARSWLENRAKKQL